MCKRKNVWQRASAVFMGILLFCSPVWAHKKSEEKDRAIISGQVTDVGGFPLEGVTVSVNGKRPSAVTNAGGIYVLDSAKREDRVVIEFRKDGYATTQAIAVLKIKQEKCKGREGGEEHSQQCKEKDGRERKIDFVTLNKVMAPTGAAHSIDATSGGTLAQDGFKAAFSPESLSAKGSVDVVITPLDISTNALLAFPGDFTGISSVGKRVLLETFSVMDVSITQNGMPVNLKPGTTAALEFLLPRNTSLDTGAIVPLWFYDEKKGIWREEGTGIVDVSTTDPSRLAVFGEVSHFSWWNVDVSIDRTCVKGFVYDANGSPVKGASVYATGVNYSNLSISVTDAMGQYCLYAKISSTLTLKAFYAASGIIQSSNSVRIATPSSQNSCGGGGCTSAPALTLTGTSCIRGDVVDDVGNPATGVLVQSTGGNFITTDGEGSFCMEAPASQDVTVFTSGYPAVTVTTPPPGNDCVVGGCATASIRPGAAEACLRVATAYDPGFPAPNIPVGVFKAGTNILLAQGQTDASGIACINGLQSGMNTDVQSLDLLACRAFAKNVNTGPGGTSCTANTCVNVLLICVPQ